MVAWGRGKKIPLRFLGLSCEANVNQWIGFDNHVDNHISHRLLFATSSFRIRVEV